MNDKRQATSQYPPGPSPRASLLCVCCCDIVCKILYMGMDVDMGLDLDFGFRISDLGFIRCIPGGTKKTGWWGTPTRTGTSTSPACWSLSRRKRSSRSPPAASTRPPSRTPARYSRGAKVTSVWYRLLGDTAVM